MVERSKTQQYYIFLLQKDSNHKQYELHVGKSEDILVWHLMKLLSTTY